MLYPNFIDAERCDRIIELSRARLTSSMVAFTPDMTVDPKQQMRTSSGVFVAREDDAQGVLAWAEERIAAVTMIPSHHGEAFNVLRYENDQKYDAHLDVFDPKLFGPQKSQRVATAIMYLSDVEDGGETAFQLEGRGGEFFWGFLCVPCVKKKPLPPLLSLSLTHTHAIGVNNTPTNTTKTNHPKRRGAAADDRRQLRGRRRVQVPAAQGRRCRVLRPQARPA